MRNSEAAQQTSSWAPQDDFSTASSSVKTVNRISQAPLGVHVSLSGCTGPGKDLVHSRSACRWPLQGDPPGYWLLERAQPWVESGCGCFGCKEDWQQSQDNVSRKVAGLNIGAGKVFLTQNLCWSYLRCLCTLSMYLWQMSTCLCTPVVHVSDVPELNKQKESGVGPIFKNMNRKLTCYDFQGACLKFFAPGSTAWYHFFLNFTSWVEMQLFVGPG